MKNRKFSLRGLFSTSALVADRTVDAAVGTLTVIIKLIFSILLVLLIAGLLFSLIFAYYVKSCLTPTVGISLEEYRLSESSTIWYKDSSGKWQVLETLSGKQNRVWVDLDQIPDYMSKAVIAIEDKRFYDHQGVDWFRTGTAFFKMFATMQDTYGGSTITQQLIKNLTGNDEVTVQRKLSEIFSAMELEKKYQKDEILEWYLNAVYFGEGCWGVQTAARTYFGKDVKDLTLAECAAIAGITNQPTKFDPFYNEENNKERQETILREMYEQGYIDHDTYLAACAEELVFAHSANTVYTQKIYSYYTETVINDAIADLMRERNIGKETAKQLIYGGGYQIYCCLDPEIQGYVDDYYSDLSHFSSRGSSQQLQSAIVILDPFNGDIVALAGGVGTKTQNFPLNRASDSTRPTGSAIKPLASYGPAVEIGLITPNTLVNDSPDIRLTGTDWYPHNYDSNGYMGIVTINTALVNSINTVAAQIVDKLTPQYCYDYLVNKLGFTSLVEGSDNSYAPMAVGQQTNGVTVREMAQAYSAFVNDGTFTYARTYSKITDKFGNTIIDNTSETIQAFSENTAHVMTYMMKGVVDYGTAGSASLPNMPVAGKTGTSGDSKDRWFVGCTPYYVAAIWTGYDTPEYINTSGNPCLNTFRTIMTKVHEGMAYKTFTYPFIGGDTYAFGDLRQAYADQEAAKAAAAAAAMFGFGVG
ncbi:MAG: PBP1A family penicillin-binding protein [Oscillospiraceae bacterium]|nr:PBP1A family penicillin-binding protein [Oscillospiraceae bacterium]